jgi:hypothetical protein
MRRREGDETTHLRRRPYRRLFTGGPVIAAMALALSGAAACWLGGPAAGAATHHPTHPPKHGHGRGDYVSVTLPVKFTGILAKATVTVVPSSPANCVGAASNLNFDVDLTSPIVGPSKDIGAEINRNDTCNKEASYQGFSVTMTYQGGGSTYIPAGAKVTFPIWFGQRSSGTPYFMMCGTDPYGLDPTKSYQITGASRSVYCDPDGYHTTITIRTY